MKTFCLHVHFIPETRDIRFQWFGQSAINPEGSRVLPRSTRVGAAPVFEDFRIDLSPLRAEISAGTIVDTTAFQAADEFLLLRDLLSDDDLEAFCETLYHFLWREAQQAPPEDMRSVASGRVWSDPDKRLVRVWFATHRKPVDVDNVVQRFDAEESVDAMTYGSCNVFIPESHKPGSTGTPWWRRWIRLESDDSLKVLSTKSLQSDTFWAEFANKLNTWWNPGERNAFVYIHGFNVSFNEAAIRAAQLGYDLKIPGEMAFYSWPSRGSKIDYSADTATIAASVPYIAQFLQEISEKSGAERIHVFVHSMGNRGFLSALERLVAEGYPTLRLGQVFFCAPDEDVRTFKDKVTKFPHEYENRTLLVSPDDRAVAAAKWLYKHGRVGIVPPVINFPDMETIEVSGFSLLDLGHGYFASAEPVILDIREAIETRKQAGDREIPRVVGDYFSIDIRQK